MTQEEYLVKSAQRGWKYKRLVDHPAAKNIDYIHPLKQRLVDEIVNRAQEEKAVRRIIVFGSAITKYCNPLSDLDLCIDWTERSHDDDGVYEAFTRPLMRYISLQSKGNCDVLAYDDIANEELRKNIENGVVVYEHDV